VSGEALQSPVGGLGCGITSSTIWNLETPKGKIGFSISNIQLLLFCTGIGFLVFCAFPETSHPDVEVDVWLNFLHYFRFFKGQRGVSVNAKRRVGFDRKTGLPTYSSHFPVHDKQGASSPCEKKTIGQIIQLLLGIGQLPTEEDNWWSDIFVPGQLIPYVSIFLDEVPDDNYLPLTYSIRNFFPSGKNHHFSSGNFQDDESSTLLYTHNQYFFFSLNGGGFIAFDAPKNEFFRTGLPDHLKDQYHLLFLLSLHQRFTLMMLLDQVASSWLAEGVSIEQRKTSFDQIREQLFAFTSRGYFAQVMQSENHHRVYIKWQKIFQIERLYQDISNEIHFMSDYLQSEQDRRNQENEENLNKILNAIAFFVGVPAIVLTIVEVGFSDAGWFITLVSSLGSFLFGGFLYWLIKWRSLR
jgi:hypothetical protein